MAIQYRLTGIDGTTIWNFRNDPLTLGADPNVGGAQITNQRLTNVYQAGGTWVGRNLDIAPLVLDVMLRRRIVGDPVELWSEWRDSLGLGEHLLLWEVISDHGGTRFQHVRLEGVTSESPLSVIQSTKCFREKIMLASDESWYRKVPVEATFAVAGWAAAEIQNLGDIESPLRYEVTGPVTNLTLGVEGEEVEMTGTTIPGGETWIIETDPESPRIMKSTGENMWPDVHENNDGPVSWHKFVPSRWDDVGPVPVHISGSGTSGATSVKLVLPQLFARGA